MLFQALSTQVLLLTSQTTCTPLFPPPPTVLSIKIKAIPIHVPHSLRTKTFCPNFLQHLTKFNSLASGREETSGVTTLEPADTLINEQTCCNLLTQPELSGVTICTLLVAYSIQPSYRPLLTTSEISEV